LGSFFSPFLTTSSLSPMAFTFFSFFSFCFFTLIYILRSNINKLFSHMTPVWSTSSMVFLSSFTATSSKECSPVRIRSLTPLILLTMLLLRYLRLIFINDSCNKARYILRFLYLNERMVMVSSVLTDFTVIEVFAYTTFVSCANDWAYTTAITRYICMSD